MIGIQLEAFNDLERLGITGISPEVYEKYHALEAESYTGNLITNIFAGGTVRTERAFLTGDVTLETSAGTLGPMSGTSRTRDTIPRASIPITIITTTARM